jgi:hypothetical protein
VQIQCIVAKLLCTKFFESLLHNIDLCQLEVAERLFQIGWRSREIWNECFTVIVETHNKFCISIIFNLYSRKLTLFNYRQYHKQRIQQQASLNHLA